MKQVADDNFKFDENGRKFCKRIETPVGKGEIARNEQFLLYPQGFLSVCRAISPFPTVFSKDLLQTRKNQGLFGKDLKTDQAVTG